MYNESTLAHAIRFLSVDAIQKANSGHPGMPLGMADIATVLWREFLRHNPLNPSWINRDRFVLSNGHGSMLLYSLLYLTGYDLSIDDLKNFRQFQSKTPGHPEYGETPGVETTTGPLGQGLANAVGMALAEKMLAAQFNRENFAVIDHYTYAFVGDGCLMEGISHEAAAFAGAQGLGKLIVFWDNNHISIDGDTAAWFNENVAERFRAYHWQVIDEINAYDHEALRNAIRAAQANEQQPTLINCRTIIGKGAPHKSNKAACHGSPLGDEEISAMRQELNWPYAPFEIPQEMLLEWNQQARGTLLNTEWQQRFDAYQQKYPELATELLRRLAGKLPEVVAQTFAEYFAELIANPPALATRQASQQVLEKIAPVVPELLGGAADLTPSNLTSWSGSKSVTAQDATGNYLHYGVREFGMSAIMNGLALYGGFIPYAGTFLVFANYAQSAIRMAALMRQRVIYVLTHDSIGVGEDGPTHQPIEHLAMLRSTPNLAVWRPADMLETAVAWQAALQRVDGPTALILSRQKLPPQVKDVSLLADVARGGYILRDCIDQRPELILLAAGSEVALAVEVAERLTVERKLKVRVVSLPSFDHFDAQPVAYREKVLPPDVTRRVAIEAAAAMPWYKYVGSAGQVIALDRYGASAPAKILFEFFGFSADNICRLI